MKLADLIRAPGTMRMSHTRLWANVAYATATGCLLWQTHQGKLTSDLLLVYLGVVGASATASKFLSLRYGTPPDKSPQDQGGSA